MNLINFRPIAEDIWIDSIKLFRCGSQIVQKAGQVQIYPLIDCHIDLRTDQECTQDLSNYFLTITKRKSRYSLSDHGLDFKQCLIPSVDDYIAYYKDILRVHANVIVSIFHEISRSKDQTFLISCYAGKDRTGIISALLLSIIGIDFSYISNDYVKSGEYLLKATHIFKKNWEKRGLAASDYVCRLLPQKTVLQAIFDYLITEYGGVFKYLSIHGFYDKDLYNIKIKFIAFIKPEALNYAADHI